MVSKCQALALASSRYPIPLNANAACAMRLMLVICSKMRADGFGGMALFITADAIKACSTTEFLSDCLADIAGQEDG